MTTPKNYGKPRINEYILSLKKLAQENTLYKRDSFKTMKNGKSCVLKLENYEYHYNQGVNHHFELNRLYVAVWVLYFIYSQ